MRNEDTEVNSVPWQGPLVGDRGVVAPNYSLGPRLPALNMITKTMNSYGMENYNYPTEI